MRSGESVRHDALRGGLPSEEQRDPRMPTRWCRRRGEGDQRSDSETAGAKHCIFTVANRHIYLSRREIVTGSRRFLTELVEDLGLAGAHSLSSQEIPAAAMVTL